MITQKQFDTRVAALWSSQKSIGREKKWKSGKRAGLVRKQAAQIDFTREQLWDALWMRVGLNAMPCPYCKKPIDILSLTLDHIVPRSAGGEFSLTNMQCICPDCNAMKGDLTHEAFVRVLALARILSAYDSAKFLSKLKASHHGSGRRFFRDKDKQPGEVKYLPPPAMQQELNDF